MVGLLMVILLGALAGATGTRASAAAACAKTPMVRSLVLISARTGAIKRSFADVDDGGVSAVLAYPAEDRAPTRGSQADRARRARRYHAACAVAV
jgi:hypothetical protein